MIYKPHKYQQAALRWVLDRPRCCLFLDMGLGKSVITLTAIQHLIDDCEIRRALVVAPKKVAETTWSAEAEKWDHLSLRVSRVVGTARRREAALAMEADVYVIGRDSLVWLVGKYGGILPFDMVVLDELTSFKNRKSQRFKAMRMASPSMRRVVGLTGTPAPNGLIDLWAELYCVDMGARLGRFFTKYRDTYFDVHTWNNIVVHCTPKKGCEDAIRARIADICLSMSAADYLTLPDLMEHTVRVVLSDKSMKAYNAFERERVIEFLDAHSGEKDTVLAASVAGLMNKLSQFANGAVYDTEGNHHVIHDEKLEALVELVEAAQGGVLVFYQYRHDAERIEECLKGRAVARYEGASQLDAWNAGKIDVLLAHPASTAFGLNMQSGGHYIVWFGTGWNLELYQQANARLHRQGQRHPVQVYRLVCDGTVDERALAALEGKQSVQQGLLEGLRYLERKVTEIKANNYGQSEGKDA